MATIRDTLIERGRYQTSELLVVGRHQVRQILWARKSVRRPIMGAQTQRSLIHFTIGEDRP